MKQDSTKEKHLPSLILKLAIMSLIIIILSALAAKFNIALSMVILTVGLVIIIKVLQTVDS